MTVRIAMWSGPRNLSTAMMRSFSSRADTFVSDEPFYGCFLKTSGANHPMRDRVIEAMDCNWGTVMANLKSTPSGNSSIWYQKHMWHHMVGPIGFEDFEGFRHAFLIRDPKLMIASYLRKRETADVEDFGLERQAEFFSREADRLGHPPPVVDANDVLQNPAQTLERLCNALKIPWDRAMLSWSPGPRTTDGPWAPHWYSAVEKSTGFGTPEVSQIAPEGEAERLLDRCQPFYEELARYRIR